MANKIFTPSYISFETVPGKEGVIFQRYDQIFVASYLARAISCDGRTYVFRRMKKAVLLNASGIEPRKGCHIASKERAQNIKVEINQRSFGSRFELKNYLGIPMLVMIREDMFAHKLVAVLERAKAANRDVYDIWHCLKNRWPVNREIVEKRTQTSFEDHLKACIEFIESLRDRNILSGIGELLDEKQKTWAKSQLKKETVYLLKLRLEQLG